MGLYERLILPRIVDLACRIGPITRQREKIVPRAGGVVLDLGFGTGRNLPHYDETRVDRIWALDPSREMWELAGELVESSSIPVEYVEAPGEEIPLDDSSVDTVVVTYTLCSIPEPRAALREVRRILKKDGVLLFTEHGAAPDRGVKRWQNWVNPVWKRFSGGCHLNREIDAIIGSSGFDLDEISTMYIPGWKPASFNYWGVAKIADGPKSDDHG